MCVIFLKNHVAVRHFPRVGIARIVFIYVDMLIFTVTTNEKIFFLKF